MLISIRLTLPSGFRSDFLFLTSLQASVRPSQKEMLVQPGVVCFYNPYTQEDEAGGLPV
jgi:hypothetical protein